MRKFSFFREIFCHFQTEKMQEKIEEYKFKHIKESTDKRIAN